MLTQRHRVTEKLIIPQYGEAIPVNSIYNYNKVFLFLFDSVALCEENYRQAG